MGTDATGQDIRGCLFISAHYGTTTSVETPGVICTTLQHVSIGQTLDCHSCEVAWAG